MEMIEPFMRLKTGPFEKAPLILRLEHGCFEIRTPLRFGFCCWLTLTQPLTHEFQKVISEESNVKSWKKGHLPDYVIACVSGSMPLVPYVAEVGDWVNSWSWLGHRQHAATMTKGTRVWLMGWRYKSLAKMEKK